MSGDLGTNLKWAGHDSMVITGKAARSVYITIFDDDVKINDAGDLWDKGVYEATDELWVKYGDNCTIFCIGINRQGKWDTFKTKVNGQFRACSNTG